MNANEFVERKLRALYCGRKQDYLLWEMGTGGGVRRLEEGSLVKAQNVEVNRDGADHRQAKGLAEKLP